MGWGEGGAERKREAGGGKGEGEMLNLLKRERESRPGALYHELD